MDIVGEDEIDPYAVIDGKIVAADPWEGDGDYDVENTSWYTEAVEADGEVIFTDAYEDAVSGELVITIAQEGEVPGNVVAFDIFPRQFHSQTDKQERRLPEGSAFLLCDSSGTLLYSETRADIPREQIQSYINTIIDRIKDGTFDSNSAYIHTPGQEKKSRLFRYNHQRMALYCHHNRTAPFWEGYGRYPYGLWQSFWCSLRFS